MHIKTEKGKHYTSPQAHTDENGLSNNFTMINHDVKTTMGVTDSSWDRDWLSKAKTDVLKEIGNISASLCPEPYLNFTIRGKDVDVISWNSKSLEDVEITRLWFLRNILSNRMETFTKTY